MTNEFLSPNGKVKITAIEIPNKIFKAYRDRISDPEIKSIEPIDQTWFVSDKEFSNKMSDELYQSLQNHDLVKGRSFDTWPHVTSFAFTRKAFYDANWDSVNTVARGLFVNHNTKEIVCRSYKKFFNLNENEHHQKRSLKNRLVFPVEVFQKENGFLGLVGYDSQTDKLFITSKSAVEGDFADNFRRLFNQTFNEYQQTLIKNNLRDQEASLVFEVVDPVADPHIVNYDKEQIILLDIVARSEKFQKAPFDSVKAFANKFGIEHKKRFAKFHDWRHFDAWMTNVESRNDMTKPDIEGYVVEDASGFHFKIKTPYYSFWKWQRSIKDRKAKSVEHSKEFKVDFSNMYPIGISFVKFLQDKDLTYLQQNIMVLRNDFLESI